MDSTASIQGRKVVLCVTGGIAAYKVVEVARALTELGADLHVVMTRSARRFVSEETFAGVSGRAVESELFSHGPTAPHVELARSAELLVIAPATANSIAKLAHGFADDLLSATALMAACPVLVVPAMHTEMWTNPATQANVTILEQRGIEMLGPAIGRLMSGDVGIGRMVEPSDIIDGIVAVLERSQTLVGRRIVVTAGGTQEPIDPVRFIGNRSSGRMGYEIARAAVLRGAKVTLVAGPTELPHPPGADVVPVRTSAEMRDAVLAAAADADAIVKAAAVADFRPAKAADRKLKKAAGPPAVELTPTGDILAELGADPSLRKPGSILVGFAAETEPDPLKLAAIASEKREAKGADVIVANDVLSPDSGFGVQTNRAVIVDASGSTDLGLVSKRALADALLDRIASSLVSGPS